MVHLVRWCLMDLETIRGKVQAFMIADRDSSTYPTIVAVEPYGKDHPVEKHECVGHVQKRMYAHLKTAKAKIPFRKFGKMLVPP